jgi:glycine/D-amino acid oxidase-like deaminating enzyme
MSSAAPDVVVAGAGMFGLAVAWGCQRLGFSVTVLEAARVGAGASGGVVGALSPHAPDRWNARKQFQFDALAAAGDGWAEVAAAGGVDPGYARIGRLVPLHTGAARALALDRAAGAARSWGGPAQWQVLAPDAVPDVVAPAASGAVHETLSARISPRRALSALVAAIRAGGGTVHEGWPVAVAGDGRVEGPRGRMDAAAVVLAGGVAGAALLPAPLMVTGVKGQAALLRADLGGMPMIYDDGLYVVPHGDGTVAVGSTAEARWAHDGTDGRLDDLVLRARALVPALADAPVIERWAGVRPKGPTADPVLGRVPEGMPGHVLGRVPGRGGLFVATGGYRIGLGLALHAGAALAAEIAGGPPQYPAEFAVANAISWG